MLITPILLGLNLRLRKKKKISENVANDMLFLHFLVDKMTHMVGSYPPKKEIQSYTTPVEEAPAGMMARGTYSVSSLFTDDDKHEHLKWDWTFEIKKDWQ